MAYSVGNKTGKKTALLYGLFSWQQDGFLYGLFSWQQNGLIIWLIQLATKRPYYMAYSIDKKTALLYGIYQLKT